MSYIFLAASESCKFANTSFFRGEIETNFKNLCCCSNVVASLTSSDRVPLG